MHIVTPTLQHCHSCWRWTLQGEYTGTIVGATITQYRQLLGQWLH